MLRTAIAATLILLPGPVIGQDKQAESGQPPQRIRSITLTGDQKCPPSTDTDIVVCSKVDDVYRIPKALRESNVIPDRRQSWVNRVAADEQSSRVAGGLPNTCSAVGTGGQSGCAQRNAAAWAAARRARANGQSDDQ
ncbi:hypothetical protein [uncultured Sphingomonas sp.]|uniref:hypothetical protein n=1 Tax=uncultured Sphingomonas sp. TaxID=158754 RepID=UPI0035CA3B7D